MLRWLQRATGRSLRRPVTDATLRAQAAALGIEAPLTRRQLRRRSDKIALEHALGWEPPPKVSPEPAKSIPTAAQQRQRWDRLRLEVLTDDLDPEAIETARDDPATPTDAELREQAKALGLAVPAPREGTAARFRSGLDPTGEQLGKD